MYKLITTSINTILNKVGSLNKVYAYPKPLIKGYPAAVFFPDRTDNSWESLKQNFKIYRYKIFIFVEAKGKVQEEEIFTNILPTVVHDVEKQLDKDWSIEIGSNRTWLKLDTGIWDLFKPKDGPITGVAELNLSIRTLTDIDES